MYQTPILFIIFNRPDTTQQVFNAIKNIQPKYLYVAADGARKNKPDDIEKCKQAREIIQQVDWDCEVKTLFRNENRGCGRGPAEAITWFFENVEEGIILEDDCLPGNDFFRFSETMLNKYRDNEKVMLIGGTNFLNTWKSEKQSYHFSSFIHTWGWATWRQAWNKYNFELKGWGTKESVYLLKHNVKTTRMFKRFKYIFDYTKKNIASVTWWDFQWCYCVLINGGLCVVPSVNLITNLGVGTDSTHTTNLTDSSTPVLKSEHLGELIENNFIMQDIDFDKEFFLKAFDKNKNIFIRFQNTLVRKMKHIASTIKTKF